MVKKNEIKKLTKSQKDKKIDGVCSGFAEYFKWDVNIVRIVWLISILFGGSIWAMNIVSPILGGKNLSFSRK